MKLNLIPQPQHVQGGNLPAADPARLHVIVSLPVADARLSALAGASFASVDEYIERTDIHALVSAGRRINPAQAQRLRGRHDGYLLMLDAEGIELYALTASGFFYGLQTLRQLRINYADALPACTIVDWADIALRSDYLDLRTVYPTFENIIRYVAEMAAYKVNTLVVEYEDKLPFRTLAFLRHPEETLTDEQFDLLQQTAYDNFIEIIPKQQSFGHLEYILKHPQYIALRETPDSVGELCPFRPGSFEMMAGILEEIAALHPHSRYLHIGCDEVWSLGTCETCKAQGMTREMIYITFVNRLIEKACALGKIPIIWHDMLAHATAQEIDKLDKRVVVAVWIYGGYQMQSDATHLIRSLRASGLAVLGASAVRCWDDSGDQNYPVIHNRVRNILDWVTVAQAEQVEGIINTNWGAPFSLGSPYGLFETSRYPAYFAADHTWNVRADTQDFLKRFLVQFHGVEMQALEAAVDSNLAFAVTDYYQMMPQLLSHIHRNALTARLIAVMLDYEVPARRRFPLHTFLFRGEMFAGSEEVMTSLRDKHVSGYADLARAKAAMQEILPLLLPPRMVELFITSRYYLFGVYEEKLQAMLAAYDSAQG